MSNSKDYYKMRYGQAGFDPTEIEPQSIFDSKAMDFGSPFASTAVSRKKVIEENEKGLKEKETIVNGDDSIVETSVFKPRAKPEFDVKAGLNLGISDAGNALLAEDFANKRANMAKKEERIKMLSIMDNAALEKQDDYYDVTDSDSSKFFDRSLGEILTGTGMQRKPIQNKNYGMTTSAADQAMFDNARKERRLLRVANNTAQQDEMDSGYFNMEKARIDQQIQEASNAQSTVNQSGLDNESLDTPIIGNDEVVNGVTAEDIAIIGASANGQSMAEEFGNDLAAANGDPAKIDAAKAEFGDGLFDLSEYDPQLAKSLFAMMGAMLMGESFGDAMATGFGVMEEAKQEKEAADTANDQKIIEMLMDNPQYMNPDDFLAALQELGISEKDLPYYKSIFASKVAETNVKAAKEYVTLQANATKTIKSDLIKDDNSNHIDELNRLFSHIQNNDKDFDFSDPGQSWAVYEAFSNWEQAKRIAKEEGNDEIIMEPTVFYENLFGLLDANGDNTITVPQSQDNQVLQAIVKNALRTVYRTKEGADEAEKRISREWHSNSINKSKSSEEYLKYLAMEANDLEREYLAGLRK